MSWKSNTPRGFGALTFNQMASWRRSCQCCPLKHGTGDHHSLASASVCLQPPCVCSCGLQEGPLAFYKGWLPSVIGVIPYVGLNFGVYETLKASLLKHYELRDERELSVAARLACGAAAGTTGQTVAYPFDVARRRLQVGSKTDQTLAVWGAVACVICLQ